ncbi:MAG: 5-oxoprolinase subunit PxpB [Acidobacteriota bacterium]
MPQAEYPGSHATFRLVPASDHSVLVTFGDTISADHHARALRLFGFLRSRAPSFVRDLHPAYSSLLVCFDPTLAAHREVEELVAEGARSGADLEQEPGREVTIPVCYDSELAPDLDSVAAHSGLARDEVVRIHTEAHYQVYFIGFSPGFPYLGGLPPSLATPRLATPRTRVPAGSVAIGGNQAGIYPLESPGGWRIIGRTPLRLFIATRNPPSLLQTGDAVRFVRVDRAEFDKQREQV